MAVNKHSDEMMRKAHAKVDLDIFGSTHQHNMPSLGTHLYHYYTTESLAHSS